MLEQCNFTFPLLSKPIKKLTVTECEFYQNLSIHHLLLCFRREMETMQVLEAIQTLHLLTSNTYGRLAAVSVLSKGDLLDILVRFQNNSQ
jgi:hypothetical protein